MRQKFGQESEQIIVNYLKNKNFAILACNYQKFFGEVDIIAQKDHLIVFVEVKARKNSKMSLHNLVTHTKQQKIIKVAQFYIAEQPAMRVQDKTFRFDVALLHVNNGQEPVLTYIENAFSLQNF